MIEALVVIALGSWFAGVLGWELWFSERAETKASTQRFPDVKWN